MKTLLTLLAMVIEGIVLLTPFVLAALLALIIGSALWRAFA